MAKIGVAWDDKTLADYLKDPKTAVPGGKMVFVGLKQQSQLDDMIVYLKSARSRWAQPGATGRPGADVRTGRAGATAAPVAQRTAPLQLEGSAAPAPWKRYADWTKIRWDNYNSLAKPNTTPAKGGEIVVKEVTGDAAHGQKLAFDRSRGGGCLACHVMGPTTQALPGNVGPDLSQIAIAGRTDQWLFNYVFDARL
jgi:cytochrome c2